VTLPSDFLALGKRTWVIVAGEQGPHKACRDMDPDWARALRNQCRASGIPFFMKQMARKEPIPPGLLVRQFPQGGRHNQRFHSALTGRHISNISGRNSDE
jgi:protein gp37